MYGFYQRGLLFCLVLSLACSSWAQENGTKVGDEAVTILRSRTNNLPPQQVRTMGEWEEVEGVVIAWRSFPSILTEIVRYAKDEGLVYIVATDDAPVRTRLTEAGITDQENIRFILTGVNTIWVRDYGPWTVYLNDVEDRGVSDYLYNRPRPGDDNVPYEVADFIGDPVYNADEDPFNWVHTGGNFLRDGIRTAYSSDLVLRENSGKTGQEIEEFAQVFFGIDDYRILSRLDYDTIHHLDMHMRILDEETIAIGEYPVGIADGPVIERNLEFIRNHYRTPYGRPYRILRLPMPPQNGLYPPFADYRTYTNSVFINSSILVPTYDTPEDELALQLYREYFPGYRVVGINCNAIINRLGALHCITKLIGVRDPLWIAHPRLRDTHNATAPYQVEASLSHKDGIAEAQLYYRIAGEADYSSMAMQPDTTEPGMWRADIPAQTADTEIQYYIEALANSGKRQVRPLPAPEGYYSFRVQAWEAAPTLDWVQTSREVAPGTVVRFTNASKNGYTNTQWLFPGGGPDEASSDDITVCYDSPGTYPVNLSAENLLGSASLTRSEAVRVREAFLPFAVDFTDAEDTAWEIINPDSETVSWRWRETSGCDGGCLEVPHRLAERKLNREYLRTAIDLRGYAQTALEFKVAYVQRHPAHFDELRVNLVDQQGRKHNIYNEGGNVLSTLDTLIANFVPTDCSHWRTESIPLTDWEGQQFLLEFESIGDRGNSVYLDDITLVANAIPEAVIAYPANERLYIGDGLPLMDVMRVEATDEDGTIAQVDFFLGSEDLGSRNEPPYEQPFTLAEFGTYHLQARAVDDQGAQVWTEQLVVHYDFENTAGTPVGQPIIVSIAPNPVGQQANLIILSERAYRQANFTVNDITGRILRQWRADIKIGKNTFDFTQPELPAGTYTLQIHYLDKQYTLPWMKM